MKIGLAEMASEAELAFKDYAKVVGISDDPYAMKLDWNHYDMSQRLKLAGKVKADLESKGKNGRLVVDIGSEYGGMSYALLREKLNVLSVESDFENYLVSKLVNGNTVQEDAFDLRLDEEAGAVVSYMFLGACMPKSDGAANRMETVRKTFDGLAEYYQTDTVYCVELQRELSGWFGECALDEKQIQEKLKEALPDWEIDSLGDFGVFSSSHDDIEDRLGFRFTKRKT